MLRKSDAAKLRVTPMASFTAHSVFGTKPALVSVPTVGKMFSRAAGSSPPVLFPSRMSSLPPHEDSRLAATTAERKKIVFMLKNN